MGLVVGDIGSGVLSQKLKSRRIVVFGSILATLDGVLAKQKPLPEDPTLVAEDSDALERLNILAVPAGVHALSNHTLNEPWPKVENAKSALQAALRAEVSEEARRKAIHALLSDEAVAPDVALPDTGVGQQCGSTGALGDADAWRK